MAAKPTQSRSLMLAERVNLPSGRTRVSATVLQAITVMAARETYDALDISPIRFEASSRDLFELASELPRIRLQLTARFGDDLNGLASDVRSSVLASLTTILGVRHTLVEIVVADVFQS